MGGEDAVAPEQENRLAAGSVSEALNRLSPQHREVIVLVGLEEMSYRDVSEILGVPVGTIKKHATGKGNAGKEAMIEAMQLLGHPVTDDNEADALALLHWALDQQ